MKIFFTLLVVATLILSLALGVDEGAKEIQSEAMHRALSAFGLAKGLNMVISLIQGTELSFTPVGVGLNFSIGEVLDPFNDMVERFSWVMLASSVSLGIQKILLELSGALFLQVTLVISALSTLLLLWKKGLENSLFLSYSLKIFTLLLLLRFSAVLFLYSSELLYNSVLHSEYSSASESVLVTKDQLDTLHEKNKLMAKEQKEEGFFRGISSKYDKVLENLNISKQLDSMQESINEASNSIITLITIFFLESILLPLLYLYLLMASVKFIFRTDFRLSLPAVAH